MELRRRFGGHVRHLRTARAITQDDLALMSGLSVDSIRRIERGALSPSLDTIHKIANGLRVSLFTLFYGVEEGRSPQAEEVCDLLENLPPERARAAYRVLRTLLDSRVAGTE